MAFNETEIKPIKIEETEDSGVYDVNSSFDLTASFNSSESRPRMPDEVRLRINNRERQRMHELNDALDALRQVLPHSNGPSRKKLSKLSTLVQARSHIISLSHSIEEMKSMVSSLSKKDPQGDFFEYENRSGLKYLNRSSAFVPAGPRYSPYTSTPIKSGLGDFRTSTTQGSNASPLLLKLQDSAIKRKENMDPYKLKENAIDSFGFGRPDFLSLPLSDRTSSSFSQYVTAPLDPIKRDAPEFVTTASDFLTPTKNQNSSPSKPVLKFSVESLLGLSSNRIENPSDNSTMDDKESDL
ncbi:uncharacterized protein LOC133201736 [Saccostrea echinata]|uniref:uncharacterized protein LOC133201736 n=1 Tax=Saccostrea echinata TaxID=191078 RepID=UPI002A8390D3|nr:uncharacterized protein LOC133201736 [Saccostrea echinata]